MKAFKYFALFISVIFFHACTPSNSVKINKFSIEENANKITSVTIVFDKDLAPDNLTGTWVKDEYIDFSPKLQGIYNWSSPNTLIFAPEQDLEPMREYKVKVNDKVLFDKQYISDFDTKIIKTPDFKIVNTDFFWGALPDEPDKICIHAKVQFNYPVFPDAVMKHLKVMLDSKTHDKASVLNKEKSSLMTIALKDIIKTDKTQNLELVFQKGMSSVYNKMPLKEDVSFQYNLTALEKLTITGVSAGHDGMNGWIKIGVTQAVAEKQLDKYITVTSGTNLNFNCSENFITITGSFDRKKEIELQVKKNMPGIFGGKLAEDYRQIVTLADLNPSVRFADRRGKYLINSGNRNIELKTVNVTEADLSIHRIFKNNLLFFTTRNSVASYYFDSDYYNDYYDMYNVGNFGKELKQMTVKIDNKVNWVESTLINPDSLLKEQAGGVYIIKARSKKEPWIRDSKIVVLSDLGIIAKFGKDNLKIFINSIASASPINNAEVSVISTNNQTVLNGKTDSQGCVTFNETSKIFEEFTPRMILVDFKDDFNYLDMEETRIETSRFDVSGQYVSNSDLRSFIYSDRNLYRPGETAHIAAIIRDENTAVKKDVPVIAKISDPQGRIFDKLKLTQNKEGMIEFSLNFPTYVLTGEYSVRLYNGSEKQIGYYYLSVEDFVPDKIRVKITNEKESYFAGETATSTIDAEYLFGAKAAGLNYSAEIQYNHYSFRSKKFKDFNFSNSSIKNVNKSSTVMDGKLDDKGMADLQYTLAADLKSRGIIKCVSFVSVFGPTGRPVNKINSFDINTNKYFVGIKSKGSYFGTDEDIVFQSLAVNSKDKAIQNFKARVELVRLDWKTVIKNRYGKYSYSSERQEVQVWTRNMTFNSKPTDIKFRVARSGKYKLKIYNESDEHYQYVDFWAYGWSSNSVSSFETDKEGRVDIVCDKEAYAPGDKAKILITCPFEGRLLLTSERENIQDFRYIDIDKSRSAEIEFTISDEHLPNIYLSATLFKKHRSDSKVPFLVGHGYKSIRVDKKSNYLPIKINAPDKIRPNRKVNISLSTVPEKDINLTLAVVDEGILQIKNFQTPAPYEYMYAKRSLSVRSYDLYKMLLPEIEKYSSSAGGGGYNASMAAMEKKTNPFQSKRFELFAFWSGIVKTDAAGNVNIPVEIPQFNGEARIMAVACSGARFGSAEKAMKIADDIIIAPQIPRFMTKSDSLIMPVTLMNTTSSEKKLTVAVSATSPLKVTTDKTQTLIIPSNGSAVAEFAIKAEGMGKSIIKIHTKGGAEVSETVNITVRPNSPLATETISGKISSAAETKITLPTGFLEIGQSTKLTISKLPAAAFGKQLKSLVGYPYGCLEQTVSKLFPQLYLGSLTKVLNSKQFDGKNSAYYIKEGIKKIESMQNYDGSLTYWPGGSYSNWWSSIYAAHFLVEAAKAGYSVSEEVRTTLLKYISERTKNRGTFKYNRYYNNKKEYITIAHKEILYSLYVLSLAGMPEYSTMNYYKSRPEFLSNDCKYLLAGSFALVGKWSAYKSILPKSFTPELTSRYLGGSFDSEIRSNAIMLNVLVETDPSNLQINRIIKYLSKNADKIYSTQERAFVFNALGKVARSLADNTIKADIFADGQKVGSFDGKDISLSDKKINSASELTVKASGKGEVYYYAEREGLKIDGKINKYDSQITIRRTLFDYISRTEIKSNQFEQGQLIVCKISLKGDHQSVENIAITDMIPAGFEIENPRLSSDGRLDNTYAQTLNTDHSDIRDDKIVLFTKAKALEIRNYYYLLRAVNLGTFMYPPISGEAMYDSEYKSVSGGGQCTISKRK